MVPTFILTRTFAISALVFGAFPVTYGAPVPASAALERRQCHRMGCMIAVPNDTADTSNTNGTTTAFPETTTVPMSGDAMMAILTSLSSTIDALKDGLVNAGVVSTDNVQVALTSFSGSDTTDELAEDAPSSPVTEDSHPVSSFAEAVAVAEESEDAQA
ncbi:uncharacterized protein BXZ73DRAFT_76927 [Epithele typhae]|uniref:uncharacterized protein n=1 Tax=Epithele typhae TaxID=378194 RepID=UPI002008AE27|nr:uncharacterized protein BXZ73DRAFT_76927 [Epithele typhae]KAH9935236.1 hypothetical protein BXZ73DRAFT_76927 [Epithele typhae]